MSTSVDASQTSTYQTHLVSKDTMLSVPPVVAQPIYAINLKRHEFELITLTELWLRFVRKSVLAAEHILR